MGGWSHHLVGVESGPGRGWSQVPVGCRCMGLSLMWWHVRGSNTHHVTCFFKLNTSIAPRTRSLLEHISPDSDWSKLVADDLTWHQFGLISRYLLASQEQALLGFCVCCSSTDKAGFLCCCLQQYQRNDALFSLFCPITGRVHLANSRWMLTYLILTLSSVVQKYLDTSLRVVARFNTAENAEHRCGQQD